MLFRGPVGISAFCVGLLLVPASIVFAEENPVSLDDMLARSHAVAAQVAQGGGPLDTAMQIAQAAEQPAVTPLPNGASSITETFGDWTVNCAAQTGQKVCAMSQTHGNSHTGQQVFAIELYGSPAGTGNGVLVLPFGLDLQSPVRLTLGEQAFGAEASFTTCMPGGCIVPVAFSGAELDALKGGTTLDVTARSAAPGEEDAAFTISLSGFTAAANRIEQLAQ